MLEGDSQPLNTNVVGEFPSNAQEDSERRFRALVEPWAQAYWEADSKGFVLADSPTWRALTGQNLDEWTGDGWLNAIHPDDRSHVESQWREAMAATRSINLEFRFQTNNFQNFKNHHTTSYIFHNSKFLINNTFSWVYSSKKYSQ